MLVLIRDTRKGHNTILVGESVIRLASVRGSHCDFVVKHNDGSIFRLTRRPAESFEIFHGAVLYIVSVIGSRVRIALDIPRDIPVLRGELLERSKSNEPKS